MTQHERADFATLLMAVGEVYGEAISDTRMELYFAALADMALADVRAAMNAHVQMKTFFPRPAELREAVNGSAEDQAELAWTTLVRLVRRHGWANPPKPDDWPDEATRQVAIELYGGWTALCENLPAAGPEMLGTAKLFKASYAAHARRGVRDAAALPPSQSEARARLSSLKQELAARGLPAGKL